jgi:hypothetical protein
MEDDPSLAFQLAQGLAHRDAADAEMLRQIFLSQRFTGYQLATDDGLAQGFGDHLRRTLPSRQRILKVVTCVLHGILYTLSQDELRIHQLADPRRSAR